MPPAGLNRRPKRRALATCQPEREHDTLQKKERRASAKGGGAGGAEACATGGSACRSDDPGRRQTTTERQPEGRASISAGPPRADRLGRRSGLALASISKTAEPKSLSTAFQGGWGRN